MHAGAGVATDEKLDMVEFDFKTSLSESMESSWFFTIFFPLKWFFVYMEPIIFKGFFTTLKIKDIPKLSRNRTANGNMKAFYKWWKFFKGWKFRLVITLQACFGFWFWFSGFLLVLYACLQVAIPYFMREFLKRLMPMEPEGISDMLELATNILPQDLQPDVTDLPFRTNDWEVWIYLGAFSASFFLANFLQILSMHMSTIVGMKMRTVLTSAMYAKSLKLSNKARAKFDSGSIINYISTDTLKIERISMMIHMGWTSLFTIGGSIFFLIDLIDWGTLSAVATPLAPLPFLVILIVILIRIRTCAMRITDKRIKKTNEFLQGIKIIKFFTWEGKYMKNITKIRKLETFANFCLSVIMSFVFTYFMSTTMLMSTAAYVTFYLIHGYLDPIRIFTSMTYLQMLMTPLLIAPMTLIALVECLISYQRIENLLEAEELKSHPPGNDEKFPVKIENGSFRWESLKKKKEEKKETGPGGRNRPSLKDLCDKKKKDKNEKEMKEIPFHLNDVNLKIKKGELVMIVGEVGSGKSSLFNALLGEMKMDGGKVEITGQVAYCAQNPWIQNSTLLENVTFGKELNEEKFEHVIQICCMSSDLKILKGGRMIEIGEKGVNLSGGQKYRVSLARSCYYDADIYLLDDPLAAVDAHVGKRIFEDVILKYLKNKTRLFVTHQIHVLEKADRVVLMDEGKICEIGTYQELMEKKGKFFQLISKNTSQEEEKTEKKEEKKGEDKDIAVEKVKVKEELIQKEEKAKGAVSFSVITSYITAGGCGSAWFGWAVLLLIFCFFVMSQLATTGQSWWLSEWGAQTYNQQYGKDFLTTVYSNGTWFDNETFVPFKMVWNGTHMNNVFSDMYYVEGSRNESFNIYSDCPYQPPEGGCFQYSIPIIWDFGFDNGTLTKHGLSQMQSLYIYAGVGGVQILFNWLRDLMFGLFCLIAATTLHKWALKKVANSPMSFFDTTPIGRILNRFSTDFEMLDFRFSRVASSTIAMLFSAVGTFGLMAYATNFLFVPFLIPLGILYLGIYLFYRKSVIELKRLTSVSKSPLLANVTETLGGMETIRAYGKTKAFNTENKKRIDLNNCTYYTLISAQRWLSSRLQFLGFGIIFIVSSLCVVLLYYFEDYVESNISYISMGVSYSFSVSFLLTMLFTQLTEAEVLLNSVERVDHYCKNLKGEGPRKTKLDKDLIQRNWPTKGAIEFKEYYMKYRDNLPFVLVDVNLKIAPGEKVGVVGRTGAGKSSLMIAIFRLVEPLNGTCYIDDVDFRNIGLKTLRSKMSIIPQDPVLFSGTVRSNMDPFNDYKDEEIWSVLEKSNLKFAIEKAGGLRAVVVEKGANFSAGQRQLLCLARAILKKAKILILDECTASIDVETDKILQKTIRDVDSTILTIAHRLNTIIDYDKILVMDKGKVAEFDTPKNLILDDKYHIFKELIEETGPSNALYLKRIVLGDVKIDNIERTQVITIDENLKEDPESHVKFEEINVVDDIVDEE